MDYTGQLAVEYGRYSTEQQDSLTEQHEMNVETAEEIGVLLVARFEDQAVSRSDGGREGVEDLLAYLASHPRIDHLIITQTDRLVGGLDQHVRIFEALGKCGVRLWTYDGEIDYIDDDGQARVEQESVASIAEVRKARKRTRRHLRTKAINGRHTSRPAFGLRMKSQFDAAGIPLAPGAVLLDDKGRVIRSGELAADESTYGGKTCFEWLECIFMWTASEVENLEIRRRLREAGVPSKNGLTDWSHGQSIRRIIRNRIYLGEKTWGASKVTHPYGRRKKVVVRREDNDRDIVHGTTNLGPIIDSEIFVRANQVIDKRYTLGQRDSRPATGRAKAPRTLHKLVICARCGATMKCQQDRKANKEPASTWRYICTNRADTPTTVRARGIVRRHCTTGHSMAELDVLNSLAGVLDSPTIEWITATPPAQDSIKTKKDLLRLRKAIDEANLAKERIGDGYDAGMYSLVDALDRKKKQDQIIANCEKEINGVEEETADSAAPKALTMQAKQAMTLLLAGAREDHGSVERTTQVRDLLRAQLVKIIDRIELDAPTVRIFLNPLATIDA